MRNPDARLHYHAALAGWPFGKCVACGQRCRVNKTGTCVDCLVEAAGGVSGRPEPEPETKTIPCKVRNGPNCITPRVIRLGPGGGA